MDESLSAKIRFEKAYHDYLECLRTPPEKKPECIHIIRTYHYLIENQNIERKVESSSQTSISNLK